jgi:isopenicillin N synthase-like dioxygenase
VGGLEVEYEGQWRAIPPVEGAVICNCGDFLSISTGGKYVSPRHRVTLHPSRHRYSAVFFAYPSFGAQLPKMEGSATVGGSQLSLLDDQNRPGQESGGTENMALLPFGEYIAKKWASVQRSD